ncbi:MAG: DUF5069 domain-containing protein [bacterium]
MNYVPMISSGIAGPLGALHLPRLWQKVSLDAVGKIDPGYPAMGKGFDAMTCAALGLDPDALVAFIQDSRPTYPQLEKWIAEQPGATLTKADIHHHNMSVLAYMHGDSTRREILSAAGLKDDGSVLPSAIDLNNIQDWQEFHSAVIK